MPLALLVSTYDLGRQPFGLASPAAWLRDAGFEVACADLAKQKLSADTVRSSDIVAFFLPMHTATRLALPVIDTVRTLNPHARLVAYGLYAPLNETLLRERGVTDVLGGEFEADLVRACLAARAESLAGKHVAHEHVAREHVAGEHVAREHVAREHVAGEHVAREHVAREHVAREHVAHEHVAGEHVAREHVAREHVAHEHVAREHVAREHVAREHVAREHVARGTSHVARVPRLTFRVPARDALPPLAQYATLQVGDQRRTAGYTEASRGCKHRCRHCPIVPVYDGLFRIVQPDVVLADIGAQAAAGARHITFGDPDFFNGVRHAVAIVEAFAREFPDLTYDVTIKVEHLLRHADLLPVLRRTGCAFVTSAVESLDDDVLAKLEKGHTRADFERVADACRAQHLTLVPTFVAFTPWTSLDGYLDLLRTVDRLDLVDHVAPIQLAIRLLVPQGSRMLELPDVRSRISHYDPRWLAHIWTHEDPRVDALQREVEGIIGMNLRADRRETFTRVWTLAHDRAGATPAARPAPRQRATIPYLNEPWYC